jgi:hypothetical protein
VCKKSYLRTRETKATINEVAKATTLVVGGTRGVAVLAFNEEMVGAMTRALGSSLVASK